MEEAKDMETEIKCAMRARVKDFNDQADSLTLEGVRRMLEKDMGLETFALDAHKRFIKQCLQECFESIDEANGSKNTSENSQLTVQSVKEDTNPCEEPQMQKEELGDEENGEESRDSVKKEISEHETEETQGSISKSVPSKETIKNAIKKRASYFRANSTKVTLSGVRRLLEEDLKLEKNALDIHKNFISEQVDKVLEDPDVESKKEVKKKCVKKAAIRGSKVSAKVEKGDGSEDSLDSIASISGDEEEIQPKRQTSQKGKAKKTEASKKRKRPSDEIESASNGKNKPAESITEKSSDADEGGNASEDNNSQSSAEENENVKKKSETSTTSYGKRVERLKSIIKSCGMSVPPSVYRKAKQAPESKREAYLMKEMEEILRREGLSTNPSEKDMSGRKRRDRPLTMDEILRQSQSGTSSRGTASTSGVAEPISTSHQSASTALPPPPRPSTSHHSASTAPPPSHLPSTSHQSASTAPPPPPQPSSSHQSPSTAPPPPPQPSAADAQTGSVSTGSSTRRGRGPARGIRTWNSGHPIEVAFDETYHPVGPLAHQLISQLGHMVRDPHAFPMTTLDWDAFPADALDRLWGQVKDNVRACPELFRPVCMSKCRKMWKDHKNKVKMQHWKPHQDAPDIFERVPSGILPDQWTQLVRYWMSEEAQREAARNAQNRALQGPAHRLGTRHITQVRHELRSRGDPVDRMSVWMHSRDPRHPEVAAILAQYQTRLEELPEEERSLPSRRDEIFHSVVGRDGHGYTLARGTGIPRSQIALADSSDASSSHGGRYRTDEEVEELVDSRVAARLEQVRAEMRAELAELEARLSQSRGPLPSDPPPTTQAPDAGSGHRARYADDGEGSHDPAGSTDP